MEQLIHNGVKQIYIMKKISADVYRNQLGDATNGGLSSQFNSLDVYISGYKIDELPDDALVLVERTLFGEEAWYVKPALLIKNNVSSMFGGNFVYSSDSRFPTRTPIKIHDRVEGDNWMILD